MLSRTWAMRSLRPQCADSAAMRSMRPQCAYAQGPCTQLGPGALTHRGHAPNEAPVLLRNVLIEASVLSRTALNEAPVLSRTGAMRSMRPQCTHAQGP